MELRRPQVYNPSMGNTHNLKALWRFSIAVLCLFMAAGCGEKAATQRRQLRQIQTRMYEAPKRAVVDAVTAVLRDEGYTVKKADEVSGVVEGEIDVKVASAGFSSIPDNNAKRYTSGDMDAFFEYLLSPVFGSEYHRSHLGETAVNIHKISINVRQLGQKSEVMIKARVETYDDIGVLSDDRPVRNRKFYGYMFSKIGETVLLRKKKF